MKDLKERRKERNDAKAEELRKKEKLVREDFAQVFGSEAGIRVLREIYLNSGYKIGSCAYDEKVQEIRPYATIFNEGRRSMYVNIRNFLNKETIIKVETKELDSE